MRAMVLAAGLGTRLRPLTNDRPKALVEVGGRTMLEITLNRLKEFGVREVIINVHHYAEMVVEFLKSKDNFGIRIEVSREDVLLDTGGGLKKAAPFLLAGTGDEPFFLHNVDVISTIDLHRMAQTHAQTRALATLAVQDRESSRYLLFDDALQFRGRELGRIDKPEGAGRSEPLHSLAFSGVHVISPRLLNLITEEGAFSIIDVYVRLAEQQEQILGFRADKYYWRDLGKPDQVAAAAQDLLKSK